MSDERPSKIGMQPPHSSDFIRTEILDEIHLSVGRHFDKPTPLGVQVVQQ
jgi:hypothetical protein